MIKTLSTGEVTGRLVRALLIAALMLAVGGLLWMTAAVFDRVHNTLVVVVFAILFAYFVYPPIRWLALRRVPIALAGLIVYAGLAAIVMSAIAWLAPAILLFDPPRIQLAPVITAALMILVVRRAMQAQAPEAPRTPALSPA